MTAMAMIIGMVPMALGMGEGGGAERPLGRAVIGGLMMATVATLFFVPVVFSLLHRTVPVREKSEPEQPLPTPMITSFQSTPDLIHEQHRTPAHGAPDESPENAGAQRAPISRRSKLVGAIIFVLVIAGALIIGFLPRWRESRVALADLNELAIPTVAVVSPAPGKRESGLTLPAEIRPWKEAAIYARANGYLKNWVADIGAHVQAGQVLAEIETPDSTSNSSRPRPSSPCPKPTSTSPRRLIHGGRRC